MKRVTFPHMGNLWIPARAFFQEMGLEVVVPPKNSKKTLDLGIKYSPEFACLPLKINLGNFIEALERGADTIVMGGGCGPCRFGYYGEVQQAILKELGYDVRMIVLEPDLIQGYRELRDLFGGFPLKRLFNAGKLAWNKILALDEIHRLVLKRRASERVAGQVDKLYNAFLAKLDQTMSVDGINRLKREYRELVDDTRGKFKRGMEIKIGLVGEIYLIIEPFVNLEIEKKLGQLGATVEKEVYISNWLSHFLHLDNEMEAITKAAEPYLRSFVGGHGIDSVGNAVRYARRGFDGVIHIGPFTCMPEIVAQTILPEVSQREGIPFISLFFDEHSGDAGLITRLEAFIDLIGRRKKMVNYK